MCVRPVLDSRLYKTPYILEIECVCVAGCLPETLINKPNNRVQVLTVFRIGSTQKFRLLFTWNHSGPTLKLLPKLPRGGL